MKFYDTSNTHDSLVHYTNFLLGFVEADTTQYSLAAKARATNSAKYELGIEMIKDSDAWDFQDSGHTDLPIATTTIVDSQRDYSLPTDLISLERVEILNSSSEYYRIRQIDEKAYKRALTDYGESDGLPQRYWLNARSIYLDPAPDTSVVTASAGLRVYYGREINEFTAATTTSEVGMGEPGDRLISYMVAYEFAAMRGMSRAEYLLAKINELRLKVLSSHANRSDDMLPARLKPEVENYE